MIKTNEEVNCEIDKVFIMPNDFSATLNEPIYDLDVRRKEIKDFIKTLRLQDEKDIREDERSKIVEFLKNTEKDIKKNNNNTKYEEGFIEGKTMPNITNIIDRFEKLCILNKDGDCKYWNPQAFGYAENDTQAPIDKFFPEEIKSFLRSEITKLVEELKSDIRNLQIATYSEIDEEECTTCAFNRAIGQVLLLNAERQK